MENKKEYLNEEKFQKTNMKVKVIGDMILIIGICLVIAGIFEKPSADMYGFYSFGEMDADFKATAMIFGGIFLSIFGLAVRFSIGNAREIGAYRMQQEIPLQQEYMEKMAPVAGVIAKEVGKGIKEGMKEEKNDDLREELKRELREELKEELKAELKQELKEKGE